MACMGRTLLSVYFHTKIFFVLFSETTDFRDFFSGFPHHKCYKMRYHSKDKINGLLLICNRYQTGTWEGDMNESKLGVEMF